MTRSVAPVDPAAILGNRYHCPRARQQPSLRRDPLGLPTHGLSTQPGTLTACAWTRISSTRQRRLIQHTEHTVISVRSVVPAETWPDPLLDCERPVSRLQVPPIERYRTSSAIATPSRSLRDLASRAYSLSA